MMNEWRLSQSETKNLINLYRDKECLWNYKSSLYKRMDLKNKAWDSISNEFKKDVMEIKKKVRNLRSAYVAEKKKVEDSKRSGSAIEELYEPHLFYYLDFSFLDAVIVLRKTQTNLNLDDTLERAVEATEEQQMVMESPVGFTDDFFISSPSPITTSIPVGSARKSSGRAIASSSSRSARYEDAIAAILEKSTSSPETRNKYSSFGTSVASQLEELRPIEASAAMAELQQVLSSHVIQSLQRKSTTTTTIPSSLSSSNELCDPLQNAMVNSDIFDEEF